MKFVLFVLAGLGWVANVTAELPDWSTLVDRARWAANAHNVQSWRLGAVAGRPDQAVLDLDPARLLPQTDPTSRQLTISLGTFLAVLEDEAKARGARIDAAPVAGAAAVRLTLSPGPTISTDQGTVDALTAPTVKYATRALVLDPAARQAVASRSTPVVRVSWVVEPGAVAEAKAWAQGAYDLEMDLPRTRDESIVNTHYGEAARKASPWGITLLPNVSRDRLFWVEAFASLFPPSPADYARSAQDLLRQALGPVVQLLVVTSRGNGFGERLETGRVVQRLWLDVRSRGGELLPLSQGLQEFPEMAPWYAEAHRRWAQDGETVQMVLAVFRPASGEYLPSPRLPAASFLRPTLVQDLPDGVGAEAKPVGQGVDGEALGLEEADFGVAGLVPGPGSVLLAPGAPFRRSLGDVDQPSGGVLLKFGHQFRREDGFGVRVGHGSP